MSSLLVCVPSTTELPLAFAGKKDRGQFSAHQVLERLSAMPKLAAVTPASRLEARPTPEMVASGIRELDELSGGLPRGCLSQICGPASSGRTSILLAALAAATQRQEVCALVDVSNALDPVSAAGAGVEFEKLLWVRCGVNHLKSFSPQRHPSATLGASSDTETRKQNPEYQKRECPLEQALRVTDLLLHSGGFGLVAIDLGDIAFKEARRIPLTSWFRFQRSVEHTPTVLFVVAQEPLAETCAALLLKVGASGKKLPVLSSQPSGAPSHAQLLDRLYVEGELLRSRLQRKPAGSAMAAFSTKAIRAG